MLAIAIRLLCAGGTLSVTCGDSSPKGEPRLIPTVIPIGAFLPLPSGEVAMPSGIDGEGDMERYRSPCYTLSVTCGDSSPKGGAKTYPHPTPT